eukprot:72838-Rhodomonas_salina.1
MAGPGPAASAASLTFDEMMAKDRSDSTKSGYTNLAKHFIEFMTDPDRGCNPALLRNTVTGSADA